MLLETGQPERAVSVYREDLEKHPDNGWSLYGLNQALRAQGGSSAADEALARFETAWARAEIALKSSRF